MKGSTPRAAGAPFSMTTAAPHQSPLDPVVVARLERAARVAGAVVVLLGVVTLSGWWLDVVLLRQLHRSLEPMKANVALALVLVGGAVVLAARPNARRLAARLLASGAALIGALTLLEHAAHLDLGIDELLVDDENDPTAPGRMSIATAIDVLLLGVAVLVLDVRRRRAHPAEWLALAGGLVALLAFLGHLYGVRALYAMGSYEALALHPALGLGLVSFAILAARPSHGIMGVVSADGPGGALARRLLPTALLLPVALGGLRQWGLSRGVFDAEYGTAVFAAGSMVGFAALTWFTARALIGSDMARREAETVMRAREVELRDVEDRLRQSQRIESIGRLAGGVAHDFNNLLMIVSTYSEMIRRRLSAGDPNRADIVEVQHAVQRAADLTRQLLAFGRRQLLKPSAVDLARASKRLQALLGPALGEDIELVVEAPPGACIAHVDAGQLEQVIVNLAINARDAMPRGGILVLSSRAVSVDEAMGTRLSIAAGSYVALSVSDTGEGIDPATRSRLFEPFFTTKPPGKGTGLGLATVFGIVHQSGGAVDVDSEPGKGTTFTLYLPHAPEGAAPASDPPAESSTMASGGETVLLVEDDPQLLRVVGAVLVAAGYGVLEASHGEEALALAAGYRGRIDLLLTDVVMPRMSGRELAEKLADARPAIGILFMSGHTDDALLHRGVSTREMAFVHKPVAPDALLARVRELLLRARAGPPV